TLFKMKYPENSLLAKTWGSSEPEITEHFELFMKNIRYFLKNKENESPSLNFKNNSLNSPEILLQLTDISNPRTYVFPLDWREDLVNPFCPSRRKEKDSFRNPFQSSFLSYQPQNLRNNM